MGMMLFACTSCDWEGARYHNTSRCPQCGIKALVSSGPVNQEELIGALAGLVRAMSLVLDGGTRDDRANGRAAMKRGMIVLRALGR